MVPAVVGWMPFSGQTCGLPERTDARAVLASRLGRRASIKLLLSVIAMLLAERRREKNDNDVRWDTLVMVTNPITELIEEKAIRLSSSMLLESVSRIKAPRMMEQFLALKDTSSRVLVIGGNAHAFAQSLGEQ